MFQQTLCTSGGISALIRAMQTRAECEEVSEPSLCALRHVTTRHELAEQAQTDVRVYGGVPIVLQLLAKMRAPIAKAALGLIRNLALLPSNLIPLRDQRLITGTSVVSLSIDVLVRAFTQIKETGAVMMPITDGVTMNELVECSTGALHQLAKEPAVCRQLMHQHNVIDILVQVGYCIR